MEYFINIANVLYLLSYFVRDMLLLRVLTVIAAFCLMPYFYFREDPIMPVIYWNSFFIGLNVYWILRLSLERRAQKQAGGIAKVISVSGSVSGIAGRLYRNVALRMSTVRI